SVTSRSGSDTASGMPGRPPPDPTSTIGPSKHDTTPTPRNESPSSARRASSTSSMAVSPGVATRAASQSSSNGPDDDEAGRLGALASRRDAGELLEAEVHDLALDCRHRIQLDGLGAGERPFRGAHGQRLQRRPAPIAVAGGVDDDLLAIVGMTAIHRGV